MEFQGYHAIFFEVENEVFLQEIGPRHLFNELPKALSTEKHFIAVMPVYLNCSMLVTRFVDSRKTLPIKAYDPFVPFLSGSEFFQESILEPLRSQVQIGWQIGQTQIRISSLQLEMLHG